MDLFGAPPPSRQQSSPQPLAERMRPTRLEEFVGQDHLLGSGKLLSGMLGSGKLRSLILWGPPGSGKTTLAQLIAKSAQAVCVNFSAVTSGVKDLKKIIHEAEQLQRLGKPTVLFIDEIHHFNKAQQDNLLPHVERGTLILIGATTENPSFEVISPLLSRCQVLVLKALTPTDLATIVDRALADRDRGLGKLNMQLSAEGREFLIQQSQGD
ncbi:MAG: AAA family ATPase [Chloroflexota bacterium]